MQMFSKDTLDTCTFDWSDAHIPALLEFALQLNQYLQRFS